MKTKSMVKFKLALSNQTVRLMKSTFAFIILGVVFSYKLSAQRDLILTTAGEEIRCRILEETPIRFKYAYVKNDKVLRNEIFKNLVKNFKYNHYDSDLVKSKDLGVSTSAPANTATRVDTRKSDSKPSEKLNRKQENAEFKPEIPVENIKVGPSISEVEKKSTEKEETSKGAVNTDKTKANTNATIEKKSTGSTTVETERNAENEVPQSSKPQNKMKEDASETKEAMPLDDKEIEESKIDKKAIRAEKAPEKKEDVIMKEAQLPDPYKNYLKYRVGVKAGIGNINQKITQAENAYSLYQEKLLRGWTFGADAAYFFKETIGAGVVFTNFQTKNSAENLDYSNLISNATVTNGSLENNVSYKFIGPSLFLRKSIDFKTFVVLGLAPGMYLYTDKGHYNDAAFEFKGKDYGAAATLGVDFLLGNDITGRDVILSLEAGYNYGRLKSLDYGDGNGLKTLATPIKMDRLDFSIGLRFMRFPRYLK